MMLEQIVQDLQNHLQSSDVTDLGNQMVYKHPASAITCRDGTVFSVQASEFTYCKPRNNTGPWTHVEVMTISEGVVALNWEQDDSGIGAYVPIESVAQEILDRGYVQLTSNI
jgi:hypothetical protein